MAAPPSLPSNFQISTTSADYSELRVRNLYLHHACREPSPTHLTILKPNGSEGFGATVANNWEIYNGPNPSKDEVVAHAQGLHMQSGNWHNSFTIVFEIDGLKGSTLQVMGVGVEQSDQCQWSIVGGTGKLTLAQGFIYKRFYKGIDTGNIIELDIYAIFRPTKINLRYGPVGGGAGTAREPKSEPSSLESIKIRHKDVIYSIEFTYTDKNGINHGEGPWGWGKGSMETSTVELGPTEFVTEVSGTIGKYLNHYDVVSSLKIVTNLRTFGPYGTPSANIFSFPGKKDSNVVGFFGRSGEALDSLGVIVRV
ncbi:hypothetical protein ACP4OV_016324 [Aristida adscensionis]